MYSFFTEDSLIQGETAILKGPDVNHIKNVLRMKPGEKVRVSNGRDRSYQTEIGEFTEDSVICRILCEEEGGTELPSRIHLFQCLPKQDKMELVIQKNVELGVAQIIPVASRRSIVKLDQKKADAKVARWNAIAKSAAEQSKRLFVPEVTQVMTFAEALSYAAPFAKKAIPYENAEGMKATKAFVESLEKGEDIAVLIGPEGGFEPEEVEMAVKAGFLPLTLGKRILRTETAGMAFNAVLMFELESR